MGIETNSRRKDAREGREGRESHIPGIQLECVCRNSTNAGYDLDPSLNYHAPFRTNSCLLSFLPLGKRTFWRADAIVRKHGTQEWLPAKVLLCRVVVIQK